MIKRVSPYEGLLHEVVEHNGVLYIGGIVPEDTSRDMLGQANDVLGQLAQLLKSLGSDLANVLQVTIYMTDLGEKAEFNAAWKAHFAEAHLPARAAIGVADLGPGVKLEITAIAARGSSSLDAWMPQRNDTRGRQIERRRREIELVGKPHQKTSRKGTDAVAVGKDDRRQRIGLNRDGDAPGTA